MLFQCDKSFCCDLQSKAQKTNVSRSKISNPVLGCFTLLPLTSDLSCEIQRVSGSAKSQTPRYSVKFPLGEGDRLRHWACLVIVYTCCVTLDVFSGHIVAQLEQKQWESVVIDGGTSHISLGADGRKRNTLLGGKWMMQSSHIFCSIKLKESIWICLLVLDGSLRA